MVEAVGVEPASETADNKERLHAQSRSIDFALDPQNGQGESNASPWISSRQPGHSYRRPACCMTFALGPQTKLRRTAT
jgi:hypothetical protein